jgi:hypothetical protein
MFKDLSLFESVHPAQGRFYPFHRGFHTYQATVYLRPIFHAIRGSDMEST